MLGISDHPHKMFKKTLHRKNDSEEIDVFEAAKYFSAAANEAYPNTTTTASKFSQKDRPGARLSLDMPMRNSISSQTLIIKENHQTNNNEKKHKQPNSPGGKLANFLNSLFNQTSLKKMKSKAFTAKSVKDIDDESSPSLRRKRRSSISNFQLQSKQNNFQSKNSGFRTPPAAFAQSTPNGSSYKEFRCYSDHKEISPFSYKNYGNLNHPSAISIGVIKDENLKHAKNGFVDFSKADDGSDSDSSSDLFDLPNSDLDLYSNGLPVYETTNIDTLKRSTPVSKG